MTKLRDFISALAFALGLVLGGLVSWSYAETLSFEWTANPEGTDGYRMYMDSSDLMILDIPNRLTTTASVDVDLKGECHNFWLRAYNAEQVSGNSDIAVGCPVSTDPPPATQPPVSVGGFTVTVTVEPN